MIKLTSSKYFDFELVYIEEIDFVFISIFLGLLIEQFGLYRVLGYLDVIMNRFSIIDSLSTVHRGDFFFHLKTYESKSNQTKKKQKTKYIKCFPFHSFFWKVIRNVGLRGFGNVYRTIGFMEVGQGYILKIGKYLQ